MSRKKAQIIVKGNINPHFSMRHDGQKDKWMRDINPSRCWFDLVVTKAVNREIVDRHRRVYGLVVEEISLGMWNPEDLWRSMLRENGCAGGAV